MKRNLFVIIVASLLIGCGGSGSVKKTVANQKFSTTRSQTTDTLFNYAKECWEEPQRQIGDMGIEGHKKGEPYPSKVIKTIQTNYSKIIAKYDFTNSTPIVVITITDTNETSQAEISSYSKKAVDQVLYWIQNDSCTD